MVARDDTCNDRGPHDSGILVEGEESSDSPTSSWKHPGSIWHDQRILNIEGEGLRGLSSLYILKELMSQIGDVERQQEPKASSSAASPLFRHLSPQATSVEPASPPASSALLYRPCHYFDFICGTSSGGLSAIMLGRLRFTVEESIERYEMIAQSFTPRISKAPKTFYVWDRRARKIKDSEDLAQQLLRALDEDGSNLFDDHNEQANVKPVGAHPKSHLATMKVDEHMCKTVVFTTYKARKGIKRPFVFRSYHQSGTSALVRNSMQDTTNVYLVDACRASVSPENVRIDDLGTFRDASVSKMNPAIEACNEVRENYNAKVQCIVSVGLSSSYSSEKAPDASSNVRHGQLDKELQAEAERYGFKATRFADVVLAAQITDSRASSVEEIRERAKQYCEGEITKKDLKRWAHALVNLRRRRAETARWNEYAGFKLWYPDEEEANSLSVRPENAT